MGFGSQDPRKRYPFPWGERRQRISVRAAGGMFLSPPAHLVGQKGSAYAYGGAIVGGHVNLWSDGQTVWPMIPIILNSGGMGAQVSLLLGGTGAGSKDQMVEAGYASGPVPNTDFDGPALVIANGEGVFQTTLQSGTPRYGAVLEGITAAGTVSVTAASVDVVGAGTAFTTAALSTAYAYTASANLLRLGDLIHIVQGANEYWHRVVQVSSATAMKIYPAWQGTTAAGLTYTLHRSGYGSRSAAPIIADSATGNWYAYYAGNFYSAGLAPRGTPATTPAGRVECIRGPTTAHFMGPQTAVGAVDVFANDVTLYKSFLLYAAGNTLGWSVAGFPTSLTTGFGTTDFPAQNTTILDTDAEFVSFEKWGDQIVAICEKSMYLIRATGTVPEFDVLRLPDVTGPDKYLTRHASGLGMQTTSRPTCSAKGQIYMITTEGLVRFDGGATASVYAPVGPFPWPEIVSAQQYLGLVFDGGLNMIAMWGPNTGGSHTFLAYSLVLDQWSSFDTIDFSGANMGCLCAPMIRTQGLGAGAATVQPMRSPQLLFYSPTQTRFYYYDRSPASEAGVVLNFTTVGWKWAIPIQYLSDIYGDFTEGGFAVRGRSIFGLGGPVNLNWTLYGGASPYAMKIRDSGTFDYSSGGTIDSRHIMGKTADDPYIGLVLSGLSWIELAGVDIYDSGTEARR